MLKPFTVTAILLSGWMISSCGEPETITNTIKKKERVAVELNENNMFEANRVLAVLENEVKFLEDANKLFLKGLNSFKNEQNLDSADYYLRQSIYKEPTAKAYFELGNVYMDQEEYDRAILAYDVAEKLDFKPFSKILYNKSCLYALKEERALSVKYLEYALQAGYTNLDHIHEDSDLENVRNTSSFDHAIKRGVRGMSNADNLFWLQFKRLFPTYPKPHTPPFRMSEKNFEQLEFISYEFEKFISEMRDEQFSREVSKGFYQYAQMYETDKFVGLVYIVKDEFMGPSGLLSYRLATFTHEGKLIDKKDIAGSEFFDGEVRKTVFNEDMTIDIELVKLQFEKDTGDYGYVDNKIVGEEKVGEIHYRINDLGKIVELEEVEVVSAEVTQ